MFHGPGGLDDIKEKGRNGVDSSIRAFYPDILYSHYFAWFYLCVNGMSYIFCKEIAVYIFCNDITFVGVDSEGEADYFVFEVVRKVLYTGSNTALSFKSCGRYLGTTGNRRCGLLAICTACQ